MRELKAKIIEMLTNAKRELSYIEEQVKDLEILDQLSQLYWKSEREKALVKITTLDIVLNDINLLEKDGR